MLLHFSNKFKVCMCQATILYCKTDMIGFICTTHMHWYDWFHMHCSLQNWYVCYVKMFPSWMVVRCCGLNVVGSQFVWLIWLLLLLLLERFIGKLHCALILIKYNKRYICFIFSAALPLFLSIKPLPLFLSIPPNYCTALFLDTIYSYYLHFSAY